jgi:hypothetical protein
VPCFISTKNNTNIICHEQEMMTMRSTHIDNRKYIYSILGILGSAESPKSVAYIMKSAVKFRKYTQWFHEVRTVMGISTQTVNLEYILLISGSTWLQDQEVCISESVKYNNKLGKYTIPINFEWKKWSVGYMKYILIF